MPGKRRFPWFGYELARSNPRTNGFANASDGPNDTRDLIKNSLGGVTVRGRGVDVRVILDVYSDETPTGTISFITAWSVIITRNRYVIKVHSKIVQECASERTRRERNQRRRRRYASKIRE